MIKDRKMKISFGPLKKRGPLDLPGTCDNKYPFDSQLVRTAIKNDLINKKLKNNHRVRSLRSMMDTEFT